VTDAMTSTMDALHGAWRRTLCGMPLALIVGLLWMHGLSTGHHDAGSAVGGLSSAAVTTDLCDGHDKPMHCPTDRGHHSTSVCQSPALGNGFTPAPPQAQTGASPSPGSPILVATTADAAGNGTGCGPPSLTMMSISRT
jgi:hypothetical protein